MSIIVKNNLSFSKKDFKNQKNGSPNSKKLHFWHQASAGDTYIDLNNLVVPAGYTLQNPTPSEIADAHILKYQDGFQLIRSAGGILQNKIEFTIVSNYRIILDTPALDNEIFFGSLDYMPEGQFSVVQGNQRTFTGILANGETDFQVGAPFTTNKNPNFQSGAVLVFRRGNLQFRNSGNSDSVLDGNYYEVPSANGLSNVIRFNVACSEIDGDDVMVMFIESVERPSASQQAEIETLSGRLDVVADVVEQIAGLPTNTLLGAPNHLDLVAFGNKVIEIYNKLNTLLTAQVPMMSNWTSYTPTIVGNSNILSSSFKYMRRGDMALISGAIFFNGTGVSGAFTFTPPSTIDTTKMPSSLNYGRAAFYNANLGAGQWVSASVSFVTANTLGFIVDTNNGHLSGASIENNDRFEIFCEIPILGWASTQTLAQQLGL